MKGGICTADALASFTVNHPYADRGQEHLMGELESSLSNGGAASGSASVLFGEVVFMRGNASEAR